MKNVNKTLEDLRGDAFVSGWTFAAITQSAGTAGAVLLGSRNLVAGVITGSIVILLGPVAAEVFQRFGPIRPKPPTPCLGTDGPEVR